MKDHMQKINQNYGFSLSELMIAVAILAPLCAMTVTVFLNCMQVNEMSRNTSLATTAVISRMHDIENTSFSQIYSTYNNQTFTQTGLTGIGITYVDDANLPDYLTITNVFCWRETNQRVVGEDANLNGQLESNEKTIDSDNYIDSPVQIVSVITDS